MFPCHPLSYRIHSLRLAQLWVLVTFLLCAGCQANAPAELPSARSPRLVILETPPPRTALSPPRNPVVAPGPSGEGIWARVSRGSTLSKQVGHNRRVDEQASWLIDNRRFLAHASSMAGPYLHFIVQSLEQRNLPPELALLPMIESAYDPEAVSPRAAVGLWQFMTATASHCGLRQTPGYDGRRDVLASTLAAMDYLARLHAMFQGDWLLALAAYNAGEGTVARAMDANRRRGLPTDYWHLNLPRETDDYVPRLLALSMLIGAPEAHGIDLQQVANEPYFAKVALPHPVDLRQLAQASGIAEKELRRLNPAYLHNTTAEGPGHLLVPIAQQRPLMASLKASDDLPAASALAPAQTAVAAAGLE
ncbi:transglycosylase SLT domain-containing protein [Pseudomonas typographi]|uniref:transglycosylase SLT domain-containing protein n=1 Tax=Pseudomonas typographi TaxID=2715964 RepID=UPI0016846B5D|nr:transglycosylase SLT domain-containing protein [Pseudomonas typographi]MBD1589594.1 transglycosylase SLT domain-containing protein [Pseudomonas typographi]